MNQQPPPPHGKQTPMTTYIAAPRTTELHRRLAARRRVAMLNRLHRLS